MSQADWRRRTRPPTSTSPSTSTAAQPGQLLAHTDSDVLAATEVMNPLPFSIGVVTLVVFAVISLAPVDWMLMVVALLLFPLLALVNRLYTSRVEGPVGEVQHHVGEVSASRTRASTGPSS